MDGLSWKQGSYVVIESLQLPWLKPFKMMQGFMFCYQCLKHRMRRDRAAMEVSKRSSDWPSPQMLIKGSVEARIHCVGGTDGLTARNPLTAMRTSW